MEEAAAKLPLPATAKWPQGVWDVEAFRNGTMSLILYTPRGSDNQTPHEQDELYIAMKGEGDLMVEGERFPFKAGDVLFVAAGREHHFENFSQDLALWVVFWGPKGGEK